MEHSLNNQEKIYQEKWNALRLEWAVDILDDDRLERLLRRYGPRNQHLHIEDEQVMLPVAR